MGKVTLLGCLYPNKCAVCGEIIAEDRPLCDYCAALIGDADRSGFCTKCGFEKENCRCKYREFRFSGIVCLYMNSGAARNAYYAYKLTRRKELAAFFAAGAAKAVKAAFGDIRFDAVCAVPTAFRSRLKRGFDHSKAIAERLAAALNTQYADGLLRSRHLKPLQHKSRFAQRLENVRGKYYTVKRINMKRVLLFDDIYTTGATLDECAKELMFAGAKEVWCVTVLGTQKKNKEVKTGGN